MERRTYVSLHALKRRVCLRAKHSAHSLRVARRPRGCAHLLMHSACGWSCAGDAEPCDAAGAAAAGVPAAGAAGADRERCQLEPSAATDDGRRPPREVSPAPCWHQTLPCLPPLFCQLGKSLHAHGFLLLFPASRSPGTCSRRKFECAAPDTQSLVLAVTPDTPSLSIPP